MTAITVFVIVAAVAIKTISYGVWEAKRRNRKGGIFAILLSCLDIFLAARYIMSYWA